MNTLVLSGGLDAGYAKGTFLVSAGTIVNSGRISVSNGDHFILGDASLGTVNVTNDVYGSIVASGAGTLVQIGVSAHLDQGEVIPFLYQTFTNRGSISVLSGATLDLNGAFDTSSLSRVSNHGGLVVIDGQLDLSGGTFDPSGALGAVRLGGLGEIANGSIDNRSGRLTVAGTLNNVHYRGAPLDALNHQVLIEGGSQFTSSDGVSAGVIVGAPIFVGSQSVDHLTLKLSGVLGVQSVQETYFPDNGGGGFGPTDVTLTLGSRVNILQVAQSSSINGASASAFDQSGGGDISFSYNLINDGRIISSNAGNILTISNFNEFDNNGSIDLSHLSKIDVEQSYQEFYGFSNSVFANDISGVIIVTGGSQFIVGANSDIEFSNAGLIVLKGGVLDVSAPSGFNSSSVNTATGKIIGSGRILASVLGATVNDGVIQARGGLLTIDGALGGGGTLLIDSNAGLKLIDSSGSGPVTNPVAFNGPHATLILNAFDHLSGAIAHWQATDQIDFSGMHISAAREGDHQLTLIDAYGAHHSLMTDGSIGAASSFSIASDGHGGTLVTLLSAGLDAHSALGGLDSLLI